MQFSGFQWEPDGDCGGLFKGLQINDCTARCCHCTMRLQRNYKQMNYKTDQDVFGSSC